MPVTPNHLTKNVKLFQKAVLVKNNKILILKRSEKALTRPGMWDLPGGNSEWPSAKQNARDLHLADIQREVLEETGIKVNLEEFVHENLIYFSTYFEADKQLFAVVGGWKVVNFNTKEIELSDEHTAYAWVTKEEISKYDFGGEKGEFVVQIIERSFL
jgi:8-oxo-dGTP pyrophosphatase MutT (NUDIX family)